MNAKILKNYSPQIPFYDPLGKFYIQTDGILMGSLLGLKISEYYVAHIKNIICNTKITKIIIYVQYIYDIFAVTQSNKKINKLKQTLEENPVLTFTAELNITKNIFLDSCNNNKFTTSLYKKKKKLVTTLVYSTITVECTPKYKIALIKNLIHTAFFISSSKTIFYKELVNNNSLNNLVDQQIKLYLCTINQNNRNNNNNNKTMIQKSNTQKL